MASDVDICNLALAHLGDTATVASISPAEGSAQAGHCARFYPIARNNLLEMHTWGFSTTRIQLAAKTSPASSWRYAYAKPSDCLKVFEILDPAAVDDFNFPVGNYFPYPELDLVNQSIFGYTPQPFVIESDGTGAVLILTNLENAVARYAKLVTDSTKFSSLFSTTLSWFLASMLAGPLIKGEEGMAEAKRCLAMANMYLSQAKMHDTDQQQQHVHHQVSWIGAR